MSEDPASTRAWAQGAGGERAVGAALAALPEVLVLHDRRMRRPDGWVSRANIDHIAIAASGVWVIDAKTHRGALEVTRSGGLFRPRTEHLVIGGRNQDVLLDGLRRQVECVRALLAESHPDVAVQGALCFVGTELPWRGTRIGEVPLVGCKELRKLVAVPGALSATDCRAVAAALHACLPASR